MVAEVEHWRAKSRGGEGVSPPCCFLPPPSPSPLGQKAFGGVYIGSHRQMDKTHTHNVGGVAFLHSCGLGMQ